MRCQERDFFGETGKMFDVQRSMFSIKFDDNNFVKNDNLDFLQLSQIAGIWVNRRRCSREG